MKVLLLTYEYPPIVAAQALRWFYLARALADLGVNVHVLCPEMPALPPYPVSKHSRVIEHRVWSGPFIGGGQWLASRIASSSGTNRTSSFSPQAQSSMLFRFYRGLRTFLDQVLYPDVRSEWFPFACVRMGRLIQQERFDAIISSHEPGVDLLLGLWARWRFHLPWVVDLADPLVTPYSPRWRTWLDHRVERHVLDRADKVIVTTAHLSQILGRRHGFSVVDKCVCIPQGMPSGIEVMAVADLNEQRLNLVYTGNFYAGFRNPLHLAEALRRLNSPDLYVTIAGDNAAFAPMFEGLAQVRFLGKLDHFECLALQRQADVLLNIGNAQSYQIPGKIYEYLAANRHILHIATGPDDPSEILLAETGAGQVVANTPEAIARSLRKLLQLWRNGALPQPLPGNAVTKAHTWGARALALREVLGCVLNQANQTKTQAR